MQQLVVDAVSGDGRAAAALAHELRVREGDADADAALRELARAWSSRDAVDVLAGAVYGHRFARAEIGRVLFDVDEVDEALQETVLAVVRGLPGFRGEARFRTWAAAIARNQAVAVLRRKRASTGRDGDVASTDAAEVASFSSMLASRQDLHVAVDRLPDGMAQVVRLRDIEQRSYAEIAEQLGIPLNTVRSRLARGRARLKVELGPREPR